MESEAEKQVSQVLTALWNPKPKVGTTKRQTDLHPRDPKTPEKLVTEEQRQSLKKQENYGKPRNRPSNLIPHLRKDLRLNLFLIQRPRIGRHQVQLKKRVLNSKQGGQLKILH